MAAMGRTRTKQLAIGMALGVAGAGVLACSGGCYKKVTRAEGFGADRISTEEGRHEGPVEKVIFGEQKKEVIYEK